MIAVVALPHPIIAGLDPAIHDDVLLVSAVRFVLEARPHGPPDQVRG
jgi:hypothetical protein